MDQNKFINTYIDIIINALLENVKTNLQLQTQVKVNEFVVAEKDQIINNLNQQLSENKIAEDWKTKYDAAESNYSAILGKLKHMDTLLIQVGEMKNSIISKDLEIKNLRQELEAARTISAIKVINTKVKKKAEEPVKDQTTKTDDF
jgi:hypothetical protein